MKTKDNSFFDFSIDLARVKLLYFMLWKYFSCFVHFQTLWGGTHSNQTFSLVLIPFYYLYAMDVIIIVINRGLYSWYCVLKILGSVIKLVPPQPLPNIKMCIIWVACLVRLLLAYFLEILMIWMQTRCDIFELCLVSNDFFLKLSLCHMQVDF